VLAPSERKQRRWHWIYCSTLGTIVLELACYALIFCVVFLFIYRAFS
jgi:hypothetical protein